MTIDPQALERLLAETRETAAAHGLTELGAAAEALQQPEADARVRVAYVGEFSNGKSQVINSLLGDLYLPASATPTTRVLTEVAYGETAGATLVTTDDLEEPVSLERFAEIETAEGYRRARVTVPVDWLRDFLIIDTPGLGEPADVAAELIYEELPRADVIVFVLNAQAALKRTERQFLAERILKHDRAKVVFLLNQIDHLQSEESGELESYLQRQLAPLTPRAPVILKYSAVEALRGRMTNDASLLERSNYDEVSRALVGELAADRRRLRQANVLARLREALAGTTESLAARRETLRLSVEELDARLAGLEQEEKRYQGRVDRVAERAAGHLDLIEEHLQAQLQALRLRIDEELPKLVEGAEPRDLRKHLPFYLEHLVKGFLEWQQPALQARLAELWEEIDREMAEAWRQSLRALDLQAGHLASALRTRPANYDRASQASRFLGLSGIIALALLELPLAAIMLATSQVLRLYAREKREEAERAQMVDAGRRAMRACLERACDALGAEMGDYRAEMIAAIRAEGAARMQAVTAGLQEARAGRQASAGQEAGPAQAEEAARAALERLAERTRRFEEALMR